MSKELTINYHRMSKEEKKAYHKAYYNIHKDKIKANSKKHYEEHKEHALQVRKEYYKSNKETINKYRRKYWEDNKNELHKKQHAYNLTHKREIKNYHLKRDYGITINEYETMLAQQNGRCAICGYKPRNGKYLHVDHNHKTNKVRKLLCDHCNLAIGHAKENITILQRMIEYLKGDTKAANISVLKEK